MTSHQLSKRKPVGDRPTSDSVFSTSRNILNGYLLPWVGRCFLFLSPRAMQIRLREEKKVMIFQPMSRVLGSGDVLRVSISRAPAMWGGSLDSETLFTLPNSGAAQPCEDLTSSNHDLNAKQRISGLSPACETPTTSICQKGVGQGGSTARVTLRGTRSKSKYHTVIDEHNGQAPRPRLVHRLHCAVLLRRQGALPNLPWLHKLYPAQPQP